MPKVSIFMNNSKLQHTNFLDVFEADFSMKSEIQTIKFLLILNYFKLFQVIKALRSD